MLVRSPAVAGQFYPADPEVCRREVQQLTSGAEHAAAQGLPGLGRLLGGIVPHAGWICSGAVAGEVIATLTRDADIETVVLFGAMHRVRGQRACVFSEGAWETPLGAVAIDEELASAIADSPLLTTDDEPHELEHSIEVQIPFVRELAPTARLLPILTPPSPSAPQVGELVADAAARLGRRTVFIGSSDLTHYGPATASRRGASARTRSAGPRRSTTAGCSSGSSRWTPRAWSPRPLRITTPAGAGPSPPRSPRSAAPALTPPASCGAPAATRSCTAAMAA
jgi:MEMO1 family protein